MNVVLSVPDHSPRVIGLPWLRACLAAVLVLAQPAWAAGYTVFSVPQAERGTYPVARNSSGTVAGYYVDAAIVNHAFVRLASGDIITFDVPGSIPRAETHPVSISEDGTVSGYYRDYGPDGQLTAVGGFRRAPDGSLSLFAVPGVSVIFMSAGNHVGQVTGSFNPGPPDTVQGFVVDPAGGSAIFGAGDGQTLLPGGINDLGEVTGTVNYSQGFLRAADGTLDIFSIPRKRGLPGQPELRLWGINGQGTVVGSADNNYCPSLSCIQLNLRAIVRQRDGSLSDFQVDGRPTEATSINDAGQVNGTYYQGRARGFIRSASGSITPYQVPAMTQTYGGRIGEDGVVVGRCSDASGVVFGYLRMP